LKSLGKQFMTHKLDISESLAQNYDRIDSRTFADIEEYIIKPSEPDYSTLANETFGFKSKQAVTIVKNCVEASPVDFIKLKLIKMLSANRKKKPALNKDHLFNACNNSSNLTSETNFVVTRNITHKSLDVLRSRYNDSRIAKIMFTPDIDFLDDTTVMLDVIKRHGKDLSFLPKKPKSLKDIHDKVQSFMSKVGQTDFNLEQREDILMQDGKKIEGTDLTVRVPKTHFDLIDLGEALRFCIGNGSYSQEVRAGESSIIGIFDKKGPVYGIQFSRYRVLEAQGFGNLPENKPGSKILIKIREMFTEAPKMPSDFLPINDSSWIHGYKYDNKDLFLLLGNNMVYQYFNVEESVYEELLNHEVKGRFVNQVIKRDYSCEKVGQLN
jgi:hypothetical protein